MGCGDRTYGSSDVLEGLTSFRIYGDRLFMRADNYEGLLLRAE